MKIALIDDTIYRYASGNELASGGAERFMWLLTRALVARGWSATVGTWSALAPGERRHIDNVDFVGVDRGISVRAIYRFLAAEKPDWCHWFGASQLLGPAVAAGKLTGTRTLFSAQFDLDVHPRQALHARPRWWPLYALGLFGSERIFVQHHQQYLALPAVLQRKACVVPGVVNVPEDFRPHKLRAPVVAWVGVLRQPKRPDLLIELAQRLPSVEFVVCGGPSAHRSPPGYGEMMVRKLKDVPNIRYLGHTPPARAIEIIGEAALLLSTSDGEGFPSVFLEAWAYGTPVVSLQIDPDGLIASRRLGAVSHGLELAPKAITTLLESDDIRQETALRCRQYVSQRHAGPVVADFVERALRGDLPQVLQPTGSFERS
jgi:glycosyltransferase involved in cell wall biosynthesis